MISAPDIILPDGQVLLSSILSAVCTEVRELVVAANQLQGLMGEMLRRSVPPLDASTLIEAQGLDAVVQRLGALSSFLQTLEPAVPRHWIIDPATAAEGLSLADSARRFTCQEDQDVRGGPSAGDIDLF